MLLPNKVWYSKISQTPKEDSKVQNLKYVKKENNKDEEINPNKTK